MCGGPNTPYRVRIVLICLTLYIFCEAIYVVKKCLNLLLIIPKVCSTLVLVLRCALLKSSSCCVFGFLKGTRV